jgi:hypothetical protein
MHCAQMLSHVTRLVACKDRAVLPNHTHWLHEIVGIHVHENGTACRLQDVVVDALQQPRMPPV